MKHIIKESIMKNKELFTAVFTASLIIFAFLMNIISLPGLIFYREIIVTDSLGIDAIIFLIVFSFLLALSIVLHKHKFDLLKNANLNKFGFAGIFFGLFTSGCSICPPLILSIIGLPAAVSIFPFGGIELKILSIALLIASICLISKSIENKNLCKSL